MFNRSSSKELARRLRNGLSSDERRAKEHHGIDSRFVANVRDAINRLPVAGSQDRRVRYQDENWVVSAYRWHCEQREHGTDLRAIRDVFAEIVREIDAEITESMASEPVTHDTLVDLAKIEATADAQYDVAVIEAVHLRSPGKLRQVEAWALRKVGELLRVAHVSRVLSSKSVTR